MRILLLTSVHNGLSQRVLVELSELGHDVRVALAPSEAAIAERVPAHDPDLVVCPMLTTRIPAEIWRRYRCLVVHPGIVGDRGPSSLDWAIQEREATWGVTILEAAEDFDAGDVWATETFPLRPARKSSVYRREVADAALRGLHEAVRRAAEGGFRPLPLESWPEPVSGRIRPLMRQPDRRIDWSADPSEVVLAKLRAADGRPGVRDTVEGRELHLFGGHPEQRLRGVPGELLARRDGAICRATVDGAVWITHLRAADGEGPDVKLPATEVLGSAAEGLPDLPLPAHASVDGSWREIVYEEEGAVGYLSFDFYNGAVATGQALRLLRALRHALRRPTRVLVLLGGEDFFCNGIHLGQIEAARSPADESWRNILAINDVVREIATATDKLTISVLRGDAAAGGVMLALAADEVHARSGVILNPHYQSMGLFGSELWTYVLPRRVGAEAAVELASACEPLGTLEGTRIGLLDDAPAAGASELEAAVRDRARSLAANPCYAQRLEDKARQRDHDEARRPLLSYAATELSRMHHCFFAPDAHYHSARRAFFSGEPTPERPEQGPFSVDLSLLEAEPLAAAQPA
jgi:putative two-component system hydrogenase maturation factor HypX/HoxX